MFSSSFGLDNCYQGSHSSVVAAGDDRVAARVELDGVYVRLVALEAVNALSGPHVPDYRAPITALSDVKKGKNRKQGKKVREPGNCFFFPQQ